MLSTDSRAGFRKIEQRLGEREWRLDNLYYIQDETGRTVLFKRNAAQKDLWSRMWFLNVILKARQLGFSTFIAIIMLDAALFNKGLKCGIIDLTIEDAKKKLEKMRFAYERLPAALKRVVRLETDNVTSLAFSNGSEVEVGTSHRGGTLQYLHVSEYGKIAAQFADKAREIKTGAFGTVHKEQFIFVESTAEGTGGDFYDMVDKARKLEEQQRKPSALEFKFHFFAWWQNPKYRLDPKSVTVPGEVVEYARRLKNEHGISLDAAQVAWYAAKRAQIGEDDMYREYPSYPDEAFLATVVGAYFRREMLRLRQQKRITKVPFDTSRPVNTFWDIGVNDENAIWFHQTDGKANHLIDYYENCDEGLLHYANVLKDKRDRFGYSYGEHLGPHDLENREWASDAKSRKEIAAELGLKFRIVPRIEHKPDAIEAARTFLATCWIDEEHCSQGIRCLDNYRKEWNERTQNYRNQPLHNWASNGADALQTGAVGLRKQTEAQKKRRVKLGTMA